MRPASIVCLIAALAACAPNKSVDPRAGTVRMKLTATAGATSQAAICATFTVTPYSLGAGGTQALAGAATTFFGGQGNAPILGCVHTPGVAPADWRYLVTASSFVDCATHAPIAGLTPAVETFTVDVACTPGQDVPAQIVAQVSIPVADAGGYIDIGVGVNVNTPQSGCKQADIDGNGLLHFGQSYVQTAGGPRPGAYTGIGVSPAGTEPAGLQQFAGLVTSGSASDAYFTGLLALPAAPQTATLVQSFVQACGPGQMLIQPRTVECVTTASLPDTVNTQVQIADVMSVWPGRGAVSATVTGTSEITLSTSLGGPHLGTIAPDTTGNDLLAGSQVLSLAPSAVLGVYGSLLHADELFVLVQTATGMAIATLTLNEASGAWSAAAPVDFASFSSAQLSAMGLFGQGGCVPAELPACIPGPSLAACAPTADGIPVPAVEGTTVHPTNSGCVAGTTYPADFYLQFEPNAPLADSTGNGRGLAGFNGNGFPSITSDSTGGYLASDPATYEFFFLNNPTSPAPHGGTLELMVRFGLGGAIGTPGITGFGSTFIMALGSDVWRGVDGEDTLRFGLYSYGSEGFAASLGVIDASADGATTRLGTANFTFPMDGFNGRSWTSLTDGKFHHFAITLDLDHALVALSVDGKVEDGWSQPLPSAAALTGLDHHLRVQAIDAGHFSWGFNGEGFRGDLDEVAWTPAVLPQTLLAQHAAERAAGKHYSFTDQCAAPPAVPPSTDLRVVSYDFAPTVDGTQPPVDPWVQYLASGGTTFATAVPKELASEQLLSFPLPRYAPGHTTPRMDSWLDPTYYAWIPEFEGKGPQTLAERGATQLEMVRHWNFHTYAPSGSTPEPWEIVAAEGGHSLSFHTFLVAGDVDVSGISNATYAGAYTRAAAGGFRIAGASKAHDLLNGLGGNNSLVVQDALIVEDGETLFFSQYSYGWLSGSPDFAYFNATYDTGGACAANPSSAACVQEVARYQGDVIDLFRQAYYAGITAALPPARFPSVRFTWYNLDGYSGYQPSQWGLGGRNAAETQPGQTFQPAGFVQHLAGTDEYIVAPDHWSILARSGNADLGWLDLSRPSEEAAGDFLFAPFLSAGWSDNAAGDVRPPQMLSLVKYMVGSGAIAFHPGVFPTSYPGPKGVHLDYGRYADGPGDGRESIWQAAVASYGQALASKVEARMRSSRIVWESDTTGNTHLFHQGRDRGELVAVRQQYDAANHPLERFVISAGLEGFANGVGPQSRRTGNIAFQLTQGGAMVTLPARRQGSFYSLDLDGPDPVLVQYDAWHEDGAFNYWRHGFDFEAEAPDSLQPGAGGAQLAAATEAPGLASLDFTGFTSFLAVKAAGAQSWSLAQAAQAPRAGYQFEPRAAWGNGTWYVWVRARNRGAEAAPVYVSVDQQAPMALGCISGTEWQWVRTDVVSGQAAALAGLSVEQPHLLWVAPGSSSVDIDQIKLVAQADHLECPLAATCGCGR